MNIIEEGIFCEDCRFFEGEDNIDGSNCNGCGCPESKHVKVLLIEKDSLNEVNG